MREMPGFLSKSRWRSGRKIEEKQGGLPSPVQTPGAGFITNKAPASEGGRYCL
jgi:hypothetical protein